MAWPVFLLALNEDFTVPFVVNDQGQWTSSSSKGWVLTSKCWQARALLGLRDDVRTGQFLPPTWRWLVNLNFRGAGRMQGARYSWHSCQSITEHFLYPVTLIMLHLWLQVKEPIIADAAQLIKLALDCIYITKRYLHLFHPSYSAP